MERNNRIGNELKDSSYNNKPSAIDTRDERSKDVGATAEKNRSKMINAVNKETNAFDLESNSGKK